MERQLTAAFVPFAGALRGGLEGKRMTLVVLGGVACVLLGDVLKGYGLISSVGAKYSDALFWWDENVHLVVCGDLELTKDRVADVVREQLPNRAKVVGETLQRQRANTRNRGSSVDRRRLRL